jgi:putative NADPH-quinone reductase
MTTLTAKPKNGRKALLLIGSPKGKAGASYALGGSLFRRLESGGMETEEMTISAALQSTEDLHRLHKAVDAADLVVVAFPLYVDQLPAPLVQALELVADRRKGRPSVLPSAGPLVQKLAAIVQCGFPETFHNQPAVDIMRQFAREAGFEWAGALAMGMGGAVGRKSLDKAGGMVRNVVKALDLAASSLAAGGLIPEEATALMAKPLMPLWFYRFMANFGMKSLAKKRGAGKQLYSRPYGGEMSPRSGR